MKSTRLLVPALATLAAAAILLVASPVAGQRVDGRPTSSVALVFGGFSYDHGGDRTYPMAGLRLERRLSRHLITEVAVSAARVEVDIVDNTQPEPTVERGTSGIGAAMVGVQAELPVRGIRPYVGIAAGLFGRFDSEGGDRFLRTTTAFPVGVRIALTDRLDYRAEVRARFDEHQSGGSAADAEITLGLGWRV